MSEPPCPPAGNLYVVWEMEATRSLDSCKNHSVIISKWILHIFKTRCCQIFFFRIYCNEARLAKKKIPGRAVFKLDGAFISHLRSLLTQCTLNQLLCPRFF
eukprot:gnl/MRDRNA2_/MRDRNA2_213504_c0_seq1.p2 gnl/MRDRNA2_/MRDRNA2_213504_c0~~gnl/MRDRNA2_/MRDRNA2_213504_c0_seq1.p2  ORF type:complete len:101 (-),score=10.97 gnl/MRDRNA2_/MRDRNA2_213504_c0_seq1:16-318(-)